jgi:hypothetical protein
MSNSDNPYQQYIQQNLWGDIPENKRPYDRNIEKSDEEHRQNLPLLKATERFMHELTTVKTILTAVLNTLDEQKELMADHTEMLEELSNELLNDEE